MVSVITSQQITKELETSSSSREFIMMFNSTPQVVSNESQVLFPEVKIENVQLSFEKIPNGIKILKSGKYWVDSRVTMLNVPLGFVAVIQILKNSDLLCKQFGFITQLDPTPVLTCPVSTISELNEGDEITVTLDMSGNNITLSNATNYYPYLSITRLT